MRHTLRWVIFTWSVLLTIFALAGGCKSADLSTLSVSPASASLVAGATQQFQAIGKYTDDNTKDLTDQVTWSSSDAKVVTIDTKGLATGVAAGQATITASMSGISASASLKVAPGQAPESIAITPANPTIAKGTGQQLTAMGTYADKSTKDITGVVTWTSSDAKVIIFSSATGMEGLATGVDMGTAKLTASLSGVSASVTATVTSAQLAAIDVTSPDPYVAKGATEQFTATGIFSDDSRQDLTKQVAWAASGPVVSISTMGLATANTEGTVTITATMNGVSGSRWFGVSSATLESVGVTPFGPSIAKGTQIALRATGILSDSSVIDLTPHVVWSSSAPSVATVSMELVARGTVAALNVGTATITATYSGKSGSTIVTVTPATLSKVNLIPLNPVLPKGGSLAFSVIGTFSDTTAQDLTSMATWGSSAPNVAKVSNSTLTRGLVYAVAPGTATLTATFGGKSDSTSITVTQAVLSSIAITPANPVIAKGTSIQLVATGTYSDNSVFDLTPFAVWTSSDPSVGVALAGPGVATGLALGKSTVTATLGGVSGSTTVNVSAATLTSIVVTPTNPVIAKGTSVALQATGVFSDKSTLDLTRWVSWASSDASVAVSNAWESHGVAVGQVEGKSTVTATFMGGVNGSTTVHVSAATLVSLAFKPVNATIAKGTFLWLSAEGTYTDNSKQDLSNLVAWDSSDSSIVSVGNTIAWWGLAIGQNVGQATITASFEGKSTSIVVTVTPATLSSLSVGPANGFLAKGTTAWFTVTAHYSDNTAQDLSAQAGWVSSDTTVALVSNAEGAHGFVTGVSPGTVTITAYFGGKSGSTQLTVTAAALTSVAISPANATVALGGTKQFTALGTFSDNSTQDVTGLVFWYTDDTKTAIVSNAAGSRGLVSGVAAGTTNLKAWLGGPVGSTPITVQ